MEFSRFDAKAIKSPPHRGVGRGTLVSVGNISAVSEGVTVGISVVEITLSVSIKSKVGAIVTVGGAGVALLWLINAEF